MNHPNYGRQNREQKPKTKKKLFLSFFSICLTLSLCLYTIISFQAINAQIRKFKQLLKIAFYHFEKQCCSIYLEKELNVAA